MNTTIQISVRQICVFLNLSLSVRLCHRQIETVKGNEYIFNGDTSVKINLKSKQNGSWVDRDEKLSHLAVYYLHRYIV